MSLTSERLGRPAGRCARPHNPIPESRFEVLALFTAAMVAASIFTVASGTLAPFFERAFHLQAAQLGLILSVQMIGATLTTAIAGALTDRFGDKAVVRWSGLFMGVVLIVAATAPTFGWLLFWLFLFGIGYAAVTPAGSHAIIFFFKKADRGLAMGIRQCGLPLAGVIGSILLPAIALHFDYRWALVAAGVLTIVTCTLVSLLYAEPCELEGESVSLRAMAVEMLTVARDARLILLTLSMMALVAVQFALLAFLTLALTNQAHLGVAVAVGIFTVSQLAAVVGRVCWGRLSDGLFRGSRALPLVAVGALSALLIFALSAIAPTTAVALLVVLGALLGFCAEGWFGVACIGIAEIGGTEAAGSALGVALTWTFVSAFATPTIFGALAQVHGYAFAWRAIAITALVGIVPAWLAFHAMRHWPQPTPR